MIQTESWLPTRLMSRSAARGRNQFRCDQQRGAKIVKFVIAVARNARIKVKMTWTYAL